MGSGTKCRLRPAFPMLTLQQDLLGPEGRLNSSDRRLVWPSRSCWVLELATTEGLDHAA
jgi:hypothetical protein